MIVWKTAASLLIAVLLMGALSVVAGVGQDDSRDLAVARDRSRSIEERLGAIRTMGRSGDEKYSEPLLRMLRDREEDRKVRTGALVGLAGLGKPGPDVLEACEEVYRDPAAGENLRYAILLSLGTWKAEKSALLSEALSDGDDRIRFKAAQAIGMIGGDDGLIQLAARLGLEPDRIVRAEIVRALGRSENVFLEGILAHCLKTDPAAVVRYNAALGLSGFRTLGTEGREALRAAEADPSPMVRDISRRAGR